MRNIKEFAPVLKRSILAAAAISVIAASANHPRFAFTQEAIPPDVVIQPSPPRPPINYYEGSTQVYVVGERNEVRTTLFCGVTENNPQGRQYAEAKFVSRNLEPGEKVIYEIWPPQEPNNPIIREINGEVGISENFTVEELPLGRDYHFYVRDRGQIFDAGPRDFICTPDILYPD